MIYFWSFWGCVGSIFGRFCASWRVFWGSWRVLGGSWEALGGSWAPLEAILGRHGLLGSFQAQQGRVSRGTWADFETQKGAKIEPKWSQNRTQDGPKSKIKTRSKKEDHQDRLGAVLGRSWVVLGALERPQTLRLPIYRENSRF